MQFQKLHKTLYYLKLEIVNNKNITIKGGVVIHNISKDMRRATRDMDIDFIDVFPKSEEHRKILDEECSKISKLIDSTEKGNFYLLNKPIKTKWGNLKFLKIRFFDKSRLEYEAAPDFVVEEWNKIKEQVGYMTNVKY